MAAGSDVVVTNLTPDRQERYSLRYEYIAESNARAFYIALTGYGTERPERDRSGFDYAEFWAKSGIMGSLVRPEVRQRSSGRVRATRQLPWR